MPSQLKEKTTNHLNLLELPKDEEKSEQLRETAHLSELLHRLKHLPRTGWLLRGIEQPESVASHSFGVCLWALWLAQREKREIDGEKLLKMALVHDLPEALLGDLTPPQKALLLGENSSEKFSKAEQRFWALFTPTDKRDKIPPPENQTSLLGELLEIWKEYRRGESPEAKLIKRADALDCLFQALLYRKLKGAPLGEFKRMLESAADGDPELKEFLTSVWQSNF